MLRDLAATRRHAVAMGVSPWEARAHDGVLGRPRIVVPKGRHDGLRDILCGFNVCYTNGVRRHRYAWTNYRLADSTQPHSQLER